MPKNKSHSGASKRFRVSGSGKKIMRRHANKNHLLEHKSSKQTRRLRKNGSVSKADAKNMRKLLG